MIDIAILRAAGLTEAQIIRVIEEQQKVDAELIAEKREKDRIRKRNERARPKNPTDAVDATDIVDNVTALSFKKEDLSKEKKERATGQICPVDFKPDERDYEIGSQNGFSRSQVDGKSTEMMEWSQANRNRAVARKFDWHLTLHGFLRRNGKPHATADPDVMKNYRELQRKTEEYRRKSHGSEQEVAGRSTTDRSGIESPDHGKKLF